MKFDVDRGTGIFLFERSPARKEVVPEITYDECRHRGVPALAFKWVPSDVDNYYRTLADLERAASDPVRVGKAEEEMAGADKHLGSLPDQTDRDFGNL